MAVIGTDVDWAAQLLADSQLVSIPTETVYGLAANAFDEKAIHKIFVVKNRPAYDPLIVHIAGIASLEQFVTDVPSQAVKLLEAFTPGPLTLLLHKQNVISDLVTSGLPRVAIRMPAHPMARKLLDQLSFPLAAPSANPFGYISPTTAAHVNQQLGSRIPYILDGGACKMGIESTILGWEDGTPTIWRKGALAIEEIESVIGKIEVRENSSSVPQAPGTLLQHYAPRTRFIVGNIDETIAGSEYELTQIGALRYRDYHPRLPKGNQQVLAESGDTRQAASRLYAAMRLLDSLDLEVIVAEMAPDVQLGIAINDRLRRAAAH